MIEELAVLPSHVKTDDGYRYDDKFINKVYRHKDMIYFFKERTYVEFPFELFEKIRNSIYDEIHPQIQETITLSKDIASKAIDSASTQDLDKKINESRESVIDYISKRLDKAVDKLNETIEEQIIEKTKHLANYRDDSNKIKITTLVTLKELGYTPSEIAEMSKHGLI